MPAWQVIGASVRGASHDRSGIENQDCIGWEPAGGRGERITLVLSDGHSSAKCLRSSRGSAMAVETAQALVHELAERPSDATGAPLSSINRMAHDELPKRMVRAWRAAVEADLAVCPLTLEELATLELKAGESGRDEVEADPLIAYGATVLGVVVTEEFMVMWQLGDGDIVTVSDDGEVFRPLPRDGLLFANETTSLCMPNGWEHMQVGFDAGFGFDGQFGAPPALVLVSTDGLANSFQDDAGFLQMGPDILRMLTTEGLEVVRGRLGDWLTDMTTAGSGDDITLGIIWRQREDP